MAGSISPESAAAALLAWHARRADVAAPAPLEGLTAALGLTTQTFDPALYPGTLGFLEPGEDLVFLRAGLPDAVRRFTLAHELGHVALHRRSGMAAEIVGRAALPWPEDGDDATCGDDDLDAAPTDDDETLRPGQAYSQRAKREGEANAFAAALLMPAAQTRAVYNSLCASGAERPTLALAQWFAVSEEVALRRLAALLRESPEQAPEGEMEAPRPITLDADQRKAARAPTPALVVAGPGSGKTSALLARMGYLIGERGVAPERVLALTYTNKAAEELRVRLERQFGPQALLSKVSTIHAFCGDILRKYGPLVGLRPDYRLITDVEGYFVLRRIINRAPLTHYTPVNAPKMYFSALLASISRAKDDLKGPDDCLAAAEAMERAAETVEERVAAERALEVAVVFAAYEAELSAHGDADYGDMILKVWKLLREDTVAADELRTRYDHILVDEFQDVNFATGALLRELAGQRGAIWAVGDVDQAIYRFRGASPANLRRFEKDFEDAHVIHLARNYRSRAQILRAASAFAAAYLPTEQRKPMKLTRADTDPQPAVYLARAENAEAELDGLAAEMLRRAEAGVHLRDQAVLLRTRGHMRQICDGLRARGVRAQVALPLFDQSLIRTLLATLSLTADPMAMGLLRAGESPDHAFSEADARTALRVAREQHLTPFEVARTEALDVGIAQSSATGLRRLEPLIAELRVAPTVSVGLSRYIFSSTALGQRLLGPDARVEADQVARLLDYCGAFDAQRQAGAFSDDGETPDTSADWASFLEYIGVVRALNTDRSDASPDSEIDAARVMTAHGAKGLEFPVVYLPLLARGRFPLANRGSRSLIPAGLLREEDFGGADAHEVDEASIFYVAMTRARDTLILSFADRYSRAQQATASPFLSLVEQALGDTLGRLHWGAAPSEETAGVANEVPSAESGAVDEEPVVIPLSQIKAYMRCPQQYAYQYVYGLRPTVAPLISMRAAVQEAGANLRQRFSQGEAPTREEALALFRDHWRSARASALGQADVEGASLERADALAPVFQKNGEQVIERLWRDLSAGEPPTPVHAHKADTSVAAETRVAGVRVVGPLDRVDRAAPTDPAGRALRPQPVTRITRLVSGKADADATVDDLFYTLVTENMREEQGAPIEVVRLSLASGATQPLQVGSRKRKTLERELGQAVAGITQGRYPPKPEASRCASCPFALICPA